MQQQHLLDYADVGLKDAANGGVAFEFAHPAGGSTHHQLTSSAGSLSDLQYDEISSTQPGSCGTAVVYVDPSSSQYQSYSAGGETAIREFSSASAAGTYHSPPHSAAPFTYSKAQFTCDAHSPSTALPPPSYSAVSGVLSSSVHGHETDALSSGISVARTNVNTASSLLNGDPTTQHYVQPTVHHHLQGVPHSLAPPLLVSAPGVPPPLIAEAEAHSPACNSSGGSSFASPCPFSDSASGPAAQQQWWPTSHQHHPQLPPGNSGGSDSSSVLPPVSVHAPVAGLVGPSPWSAPPIPVSGQTLSFTYPPGNSPAYNHVVRPLSPLSSPVLHPPPLSAPPSTLSHEPSVASVTQLHHLDSIVPSWPSSSSGGNSVRLTLSC